MLKVMEATRMIKRHWNTYLHEEVKKFRHLVVRDGGVAGLVAPHPVPVVLTHCPVHPAHLQVSLLLLMNLHCIYLVHVHILVFWVTQHGTHVNNSIKLKISMCRL